MATINTNWTPCGSASDGQFLYYGKTTIATGTPVSGTGWTLYSGVALANTISSEVITGLDDNVEYTLYNYCHCTDSGNGPLSSVGPLIKYACPTLQSAPSTFNGVSYSIAVPTSANNSGSWIQSILVQVLDSSNTNVLLTNTHNAPFSSIISSNFSGLNPSTNYNLKISYSNSAVTRTNTCFSFPFATAAACTAPVASVSNITPNSFDISWTPSIGGSFDVLLNGTAIATGLTSTNGVYTVTGLNSATIYQVAIRKNCTTGGTAISNTVNVTTTNLLITGVVSMNKAHSYSSGQEPMTLIFSFPSATPTPLSLYFGYTWENHCSCLSGSCTWSNGYDIFPMVKSCPPSGSGGPIAADTNGDPFTGPPHLPFVVNIPQGVTNFSATNIFTTLGNPGPSGNVLGPWTVINPNSGSGSARGFTDLYVKVNTPVGYSANFSIANGTNITGVTIHNV